MLIFKKDYYRRYHQEHSEGMRVVLINNRVC